jgi:putative ABC transport system permease protein
MGRAQMICRLAWPDLRQRPVQAVLLLAIMAAASALTLGIALRNVKSQPYQRTRAATAGPDVVAAVPRNGGFLAVGAAGQGTLVERCATG